MRSRLCGRYGLGGLLALCLTAACGAFAPAGLASHSFPADVPDSHQFHTEIGIFKDTNITTGCTATAFCPQDFVRRQAMAAFIDRALGLVVRPNETTQKSVPGSRVAMLDDDLSFVGTVGNALEYRGPDGNVVGGADNNFVTSGQYGTVAGGWNNGVTDAGGSVGGGQGNRAGTNATVPGGINNTASGTQSFAAGSGAAATHAGSFVWSDSAGTGLGSVGPNSFTARAVGGFYVRTNTELTNGCDLAPGGGSWSCSSDRNAKENIRPVNAGQLLHRLARIPISSWNYNSQPASIRHLGPMAQDFHRAFGLGENNRHISMVDADGVALAAIQALYRENRALEREIAALTRKDAATDARLAALEGAQAK